MVTAKTLKRMAAGEPVTESELRNKSLREEKFPDMNWDEVKTREELLIKLAKVTNGYVGADIESVCREAAILALRENMNSKEILPRHFEKALDKVRASVTKDVEKYYEELQEQLTSARAKQMMDDKPGYMG